MTDNEADNSPDNISTEKALETDPSKVEIMIIMNQTLFFREVRVSFDFQSYLVSSQQ